MSALCVQDEDEDSWPQSRPFGGLGHRLLDAAGVSISLVSIHILFRI